MIVFEVVHIVDFFNIKENKIPIDQKGINGPISSNNYKRQINEKDMPEETCKFSKNLLKDMLVEIDKLKEKHLNLDLDDFYKLYTRFLK